MASSSSKSGRAESQAGNASLWVYRVACLSMLLYIVASLEGSGRTMLRQVQLGTSEEAAALEMCAAKGWVGPKQLAINQTPFSLPVAEHKFAYQLARMELPTLVSKPRLLLSAQLALTVLIKGVPGDFVETGTYQGGSCIVLGKALERHAPGWSNSTSQGSTRRLWAADSFQGLPAPVEQDTGGRGKTGAQGLYSTTLDTFKANLHKFKLDGHLQAGRLQILQGWFNETLPAAPVERIAFLRLDGDLYVSTRDALEALYDRVSPGGLIYIDDYGAFTGCQRAVDEFRQQRGITSPLNIQPVPDLLFDAPAERTRWEAAWWIKEAHEPHGRP